METEGWNGKERRENQHLAWDGKERRQGEKRKRMFRRLMIAWIILFSAAVCTRSSRLATPPTNRRTSSSRMTNG
jgi:hypothetical protein